MEAVEEVTVARLPNHMNELQQLSPAIAKGKRTKRSQRPYSPIPLTIASPSFSAAESEETTTTAEEDTAKCLILLARGGHFQIQPPNKGIINDDHSKQITNSCKRQFTETATSTPGGACVYACKTCDRVFSSFQALGGHRTSHKKPKNEKRSLILSDEDDHISPPLLPSHQRSLISLQLNNISAASPKAFPSPRIHQCSYCAAEFTSGQALGGHMRRHRPGPNSPPKNISGRSEPEEMRKPRNGLSLDLNLPAPDDENKRFGLEKLVLSTSTPTLVDCHY